MSSLENLLRVMWNGSDPDLLAYAGNYLFEERVSLARQQAYEQSIGAIGTSFDAWDR